MKMVIFNELGYFNEKDMKNVQQKMNGKTFMNFNIKYSNEAGNCTLIVYTDVEDYSEQEIKNFFLHCLISNMN